MVGWDSSAAASKKPREKRKAIISEVTELYLRTYEVRIKVPFNFIFTVVFLIIDILVISLDTRGEPKSKESENPVMALLRRPPSDWPEN